VFLIDTTEISKTEKNFLKTYKTLLMELENYKIHLLDKPRILCFTKTDAISDELKKKIARTKTDLDKILISSITGENLGELKDLIWKKLKKE
jgi:GTPase involved in cell partitioning and DNA repair